MLFFVHRIIIADVVVLVVIRIDIQIGIHSRHIHFTSHDTRQANGFSVKSFDLAKRMKVRDG